ncbi:MAG: PQQ-binding-like beta-propeller repeat protein, partial [Akkermansiaceae bacterium]|nr:PQQ-binding-like beta-propeller repeat protein [Akkermansiaceae bacterium]
HVFSDYISDVVYNRYGVGAPIVDPSTGHVYLQGSNGRCMAFTGDGKKLWELSLVEELARLTFPNGRTGSPALDGPLVIFHCVTANWGTTAPARDRLYAFDKLTGELVWYSTAGTVPDDSSFNMPVFADLDGHRVFYTGLGCGNVACIDARTGKPLWRFQLAKGGVNSQVIPIAPDKIIAIHGKENVDTTAKGRLVCLKIPARYPEGGQQLLEPSAELWRNDEHVAFTSSPTLVGDKLYTTIATGSLLCVDVNTGKTLWKKKLGPDQLHASPTHGDGKLYVPLADGKFFIVKPGDAGCEILAEKELHVPCFGAPMLWAGKCYLMTKDGLHCFGDKDGKPAPRPAAPPSALSTAPVAQLQVVPAEFAMPPGGSQDFTLWGLDSKGQRVKKLSGARWETFIPPTARVKSTVDAKFDGDTLKAGADAKISAGAFKATVDNLSATTRGRVVAGIGYTEDFESFDLPLKNAAGEAVNFPPLPWLGARIKWHVLENEGSKMIANRLDNILFQRTMNFFGDPELSNYVLEADVATDGNRRVLSTVGLVNQRYLIALVGNAQILEISSNHERLKKSVKFPIKPNKFYRLKTHVESNSDGSGPGVVRAKAWPRDEAEPAEWTLEVPVAIVHEKGAPALFAFSPQSQKRVYIDNIKLSSSQ